MRPRLLIVDDHVGFRTAARALFESEGYDVVGEAEDGETAVVEAGRLRPAVALLDVHLPGMDGFAVAARLAAMPRATGAAHVQLRQLPLRPVPDPSRRQRAAGADQL